MLPQPCRLIGLALPLGEFFYFVGCEKHCVASRITVKLFLRRFFVVIVFDTAFSYRPAPSRVVVLCSGRFPRTNPPCFFDARQFV